MKNLKTYYILIAALGLAGCNNTNKKELPGQTGMVPPNVDSNKPEARQNILYNNPCIMGGSTFLNYFMVLLRTQKYDEALRFTSSGSIKKHGSAAILQLYRGVKVNFNPKLLSIKVSEDTTYMRYGVILYATRTFRDIKVVIEQDTSRLVLPERLSEFPK